jgi:hypothetical protein
MTAALLPQPGDEPDKIDAASRIVVPDAGAEYRFMPPDERGLTSIALATGGRWKPVPGALGSGDGDRRTERRPLSPPVTVLALGLWFIDIVLRRIRVFEPAVPKGDH